MPEKEIGTVTHYFGKASVAALELTSALVIGDKIAFKGASTDFQQEVESMQVEHQDIDRAEPGQQVGLKVKDKVRVGDTVYKVEE